MKGKGEKKDTNHAYVYMYAREGEKAPNNDGWMDGCHINSGNRCIVPTTESESQAINSEQRTKMHNTRVLSQHDYSYTLVCLTISEGDTLYYKLSIDSHTSYNINIV
jgi:hypothetical protein